MSSYTAGRTRAFDLQLVNKGHLRASADVHGVFLLLCTIAPMILVLGSMALLEGGLVRRALIAELPDRLVRLPSAELEQYVDRLAELRPLRGARTGDVFNDAALNRYLNLRGEALVIIGFVAAIAGAGGFLLGRRVQSARAPIRTYIEQGIQALLMISAGVAVLTTFGIIAALAVESFRFFSAVPVTEFLFGTNWNAQTGRDFGAVPLFFGTITVALIAMAVAAPIGLLSAIYLSQYASTRLRAWAKPSLEVLAGIPTVVYGFFALLLVAPAVRAMALWINALPFVPDTFLSAQPTNALSAGLVIGIMIIPFVSSLSDDVLSAVPTRLRDGALAMGATPAEATCQVILPAARPGLIAALLLGVSRAIGETMIVVMAAGQSARITADLTSNITTITVQIVSLLTGDTAFDSPKTQSAFALGAALFGFTLFFNLIAIRVVRRYEAHDG